MKYKAKYIFSILHFFFFGFTIQAQTNLTFEKCLELAFKNNLNIKNAELSEEIANYQHKGAITKLLPTDRQRCNYLILHQHPHTN